MWKVLKKIGFFLSTLVITAGIFWLVFIDKDSKQDVLEYSLNLLGKKLMAMVPDTADKKPVQTLYEDFLEKAKNKEVSPEKIEHVAATILNLSNVDTIVSPKEAELMLKLTMAEPFRIECLAVDTGKAVDMKIDTTTPQLIVVAPPPKPPTGVPPEQWRNLGERIKSAYQFNSEYQKAMRDYHNQQLRMRFHVEDGLKITIDSTLKHELERKRFKKLQEEMKKMEQEHIIIWRKNFQEEMRKEMERRSQDLESLKQLKELEKLKKLNGLEALESLEALKNLEALQYLPIVNADSIQKMVEKSLKEAGILLEHGKKDVVKREK